MIEQKKSLRVFITFFADFTFEGAQNIGIFEWIKKELGQRLEGYSSVYTLTPDHLSYKKHFIGKKICPIHAFPFKLPSIIKEVVYPFIGVMFLTFYYRYYDVILATPSCIHTVLPSMIFKKPLLVSFKYDPTVWNPSYFMGKIWKFLLSVAYIFVLRNARAIATTTPYLRKTVKEKASQFSRIYLIPNPVDIEKFSPNVKGDKIRRKLGIQTKKVVVSVGRLHPQKGMDVLIRSISILRQTMNNVILIIIGRGKLKKPLKELCKQLGVEDMVYFIDRVPHEQLPYFLAASNVFAITSYGEGHPKALIEAMSTAKPVVATRVVGIKDVAKDHENAILVEPGNPHEVAKALGLVLTDQNLAKKLALNAREEIVRHYAIEAISLKVKKKDIYADLFFDTRVFI